MRDGIDCSAWLSLCAQREAKCVEGRQDSGPLRRCGTSRAKGTRQGIAGVLIEPSVEHRRGEIRRFEPAEGRSARLGKRTRGHAPRRAGLIDRGVITEIGQARRRIL